MGTRRQFDQYHDHTTLVLDTEHEPVGMWHYSGVVVLTVTKRIMEHKDQEFVEYLVKAIVNNPNDVKTTRTVDERGVLITLDINPGDMGYVIGRQGQTARSIRTLLKIVGAKNNARVNLKINEPVGGRGPRFADRSAMQDEVDTSAVDNLSI